MKKLLFLAIPLILFSCGSPSDKSLTVEQKNKIIEEIKPVINQLFEITYQVNLDKYLELVDSSSLVNIMNGQILDYKTFKEGNKQLWSGLEYQKINILTEKFTIINQESVIYTLQGNDEAKFKNGDVLKVDPYAASLLFKKINGLWKITYNHGSGVFQMTPFQKDNSVPKK